MNILKLIREYEAKHKAAGEKSAAKKAEASQDASFMEICNALPDKTLKLSLQSAKSYLLQNDWENAKPLLRALLQQARDVPGLLLWVTQTLNQQNLSKEAVKLVLPIYNLEHHELEVGYQLLKACVQSNNKTIGDALWQNLSNTNLPSLNLSLLSELKEALTA